jgi:hypothetical protein
MEKFRDSNGKEWAIKITVGTIKMVRDELKIDLTDMATLKELGDDVCLLVDCIYLCCKAEADESGIDDIKFGQSMAGEALDNAESAFMNELINFFPARKADLLRKTLKKAMEMQEEAAAVVEKRIESLSFEKLTDSPGSQE